MPMTIKYCEAPLDSVLKRWAEGYELPEGASLFSHVAFIDQMKKTVVFKLFINEPEGADGGGR